MQDENEKKEEKQEEKKEMTPAEQIADLKKNFVPRAEYDKAVKERADIINTALSGGDIAKEAEKTESIQELRNDLFGKDMKDGMTNLEYWQKALLLREKVYADTGKDIFVSEAVGNQASYDSAQRVADVVQQCIEEAQGDSSVFTSALMRRTNDIKLPTRRF